MTDKDFYCSRLEEYIQINGKGGPKCQYFDLVSNKCMQQSIERPLHCAPYQDYHAQSSAKSKEKKESIENKFKGVDICDLCPMPASNCNACFQTERDR